MFGRKRAIVLHHLYERPFCLVRWYFRSSYLRRLRETAADPGDVTDVKRQLPYQMQDQSTSARQSGFPPDRTSAGGPQAPAASGSR
jgi:hypothetical protein